MALIDIINADIKSAMLAHEKDRLEAIRAVKAALLLAQTSGEPVTNESEITLLKRLVKQRKEAAEIYKTQKRPDLEKVELFQASVVETYLPAQMSEAEITIIITRVISETGAASIKDMGKVMGLVSKELAGKADNKLVSEIVKQKLS
jgi:uncharacterized protein